MKCERSAWRRRISFQSRKLGWNRVQSHQSVIVVDEVIVFVLDHQKGSDQKAEENDSEHRCSDSGAEYAFGRTIDVRIRHLTTRRLRT